MLSIKITHASLARAVKLVSNPLLTAGIRWVEINLSHIPVGLMANGEDFFIFQKGRLASCETRLKKALDTLQSYLSEEQNRDTAEDISRPPVTCSIKYNKKAPNTLYSHQERCRIYQEEIALIQPAVTRLQYIQELPCSEVDMQALNKNKGKQDCVMYEDFNYFQTLLTTARERLHDLSTQQSLLVREGRFATELSKIVAKLHSLELLRISDRIYDTSYWNWGTTIDVAQLVTDHERLVERILWPKVWAVSRYSIQSLRPQDEQAAPAVLLYDIPIALARAGVRLRGLSIQVVPIINQPGVLQAEYCPLAGTPEEMQRGLAHLELMQYDMQGLTIGGREKGRVPEFRKGVMTHMKLLTTIPYLENIDLRLSGLNPRIRGPSDIHVDIEPPLGSMVTTCLRNLELSSVSLSASHLQRLIGRLGDDALNCRLMSVYLTDGSWASVLDTTRAKVGFRVRKGTCVFRIESASSRELWDHYRMAELQWEAYDVSDSLIRAGVETVAWQYVAREPVVNPFALGNLPTKEELDRLWGIQ